MEIMPITEDNMLEEAARVVSSSFSTVATEQGLTRENCPTHPSFTDRDELKKIKDRGVELFGLYLDGELVGFVALERALDGSCYLEKLAVIPEYRHRGYGGQLVSYACSRAASLGAGSISAGIISEQEVLKSWYLGLGFEEKGTREYAHLPFSVCFMEKELA
jgi:ribosomal protein S18 acetylase RimI-like enzyme